MMVSCSGPVAGREDPSPTLHAKLAGGDRQQRDTTWSTFYVDDNHDDDGDDGDDDVDDDDVDDNNDDNQGQV